MAPALTMDAVDWLHLFTHFLTLSLLAVGGAITTAPDMHRFLVDQRHWLTDPQFSSSIAIAQAARRHLMRAGEARFRAALARIGPFSIVALLATLVLLFAFQGQAIVEQPLIIAMLAVPILLQGLLIAALGYWLNRRFL